MTNTFVFMQYLQSGANFNSSTTNLSYIGGNVEVADFCPYQKVRWMHIKCCPRLCTPMHVQKASWMFGSSHDDNIVVLPFTRFHLKKANLTLMFSNFRHHSANFNVMFYNKMSIFFRYFQTLDSNAIVVVLCIKKFVLE